MKLPEKRILVVDDSCKHDDIKAALGKLKPANYEVHVAVDGVEGIDLLTGNNPRGIKFLPDIILLNIDSTRVNGWEFLRIVRSYSSFYSIKVLLMSSLSGNDNILPVGSLAVRGLVSNPVDFSTRTSRDMRLLLKTLAEIE